MSTFETYPLRIPLPHFAFDWMTSARTSSLCPSMEPPLLSFVEPKNMMETGYQLSIHDLVGLRADPAHLCEKL